MRGISEEKLKEIRDGFMHQNREYSCLVSSIIAECKELNPWLPIGENTPKDKPLLLYFPDKFMRIGSYQSDYKFGYWDSFYQGINYPTHYQELTAAPEE